MLDDIELSKNLVRTLYAVRELPQDREDFLHAVQKGPKDHGEWLYDLREILSVVETPREERIADGLDQAYNHLLVTYRARKPINEHEAKGLVRHHSMMPFPFIKKEGRWEFVEHPPRVIQAHLNAGGFRTVQKGLTLWVLCSVEWFERIEEQAKTSRWRFDALHDAAMLATYPERRTARRLFPTTDHLRLWKYNVDKERIARPRRPKQGPDKRQNIGRNVFFYLMVEDLRSCGLWKSGNADVDPTAFSVVAEVVYGKRGARSTVKSGYEVAEGILSQAGE